MRGVLLVILVAMFTVGCGSSKKDIEALQARVTEMERVMAQQSQFIQAQQVRIQQMTQELMTQELTALRDQARATAITIGRLSEGKKPAPAATKPSGATRPR